MSQTHASSPEQRQHINLSQYAYDVILNDSLTLMGKKNISGFINRILLNCGESYYTNESLNKKAPYPKDVTLKIRLNKDVYDDYYYPQKRDWIGAKTNLSQSEYIKAILEDYSHKTLYDRESIFYHSEINKINSSFSTTQTGNKGLLPIIMSDSVKYYTKPYRLSYEYEAPFHYLICMSSREPDGEFIPASIRISRIATIKENITSYATGIINSKDRKELERRIKENGVPYILGELQEFKIKLTPRGLDMYNTIFHQRPMYETLTKEDNKYILTFKSTERQIANYFFPFAKEASIITPESTREWISNRFYEAWNSYDNNAL